MNVNIDLKLKMSALVNRVCYAGYANCSPIISYSYSFVFLISNTAKAMYEPVTGRDNKSKTGGQE